jgi:hypothetical protein
MKIELLSIAETAIICRMRTYNHPDPEDFALERVFHALSDPVRLGIVLHLARVKEATCGELDGGLVQTRVEGTVHQNTLRRAELDARFPGLMAAVVKQKV